MMLALAGPMRGYPELNFPRFHQEAQLLRNMGHSVYNPAEESFSSDREAMSMSLTSICEWAEAVVVLPRWYTSSGAKAEVALARALDLPVYYVSYDGDGRPSLEEVPVRAYI
jgi:hypothetical protein